MPVRMPTRRLRLHVRDRPQVRFRCQSCGADVSMVYLVENGQRSHNRPFCETCEVPMAVVEQGVGADAE